MNAPRPLSFRTSLRLASLSLTAAIALGGAGCHSGPPPPEPGTGPQAIHIPAMEASGKFFDNQLTAEIHFGRAELPLISGRPGSGSEGGGSRGEGRGPRGGGGGFSANVGPIGMGTGGGGPGGGGGGGQREQQGGSAPSGPRPRLENNPAVQLHLTLTNHGAQMLDVEILEFSSLLGNFVVTPAKVSILPGQPATFDPMTSRLGIPQGDLPVKVRLRSGEKKEEQTLTLKIIAEDGPPLPKTPPQ